VRRIFRLRFRLSYVIRDAGLIRLDVKLIENNAHVGGRVAAELAKMQEQDDESHASSSLYISDSPASSPSTRSRSSASSPTQTAPPAAVTAALPAPSVIVFGSAAIDITSTTSVPLSPRSTTPGSIYLSPGGVGRNIAEAAQSLLPAHAVQLVSLIGVSGEDGTPDGFGKVLLAEMESVGMRTDGLVQSGGGASTAACTLALEPDGDLVAGVADMGIVETMGSEVVSGERDWLRGGHLLVESGGRCDRNPCAWNGRFRLQSDRTDHRNSSAHIS
jgi:pseudouridine-5'-phosphate glycosidase/pseudouridine kinase